MNNKISFFVEFKGQVQIGVKCMVDSDNLKMFIVKIENIQNKIVSTIVVPKQKRLNQFQVWLPKCCIYMWQTLELSQGIGCHNMLGVKKGRVILSVKHMVF